MRNRQDFAVAETDEPFTQTRFRFVIWQSRCALPRHGQTRRKFVEAINPRDFFDEIDFAFHFRAPRRLRTFPRGEKRTLRATILVDSNGSEAERAEARFYFLVGHVRAHNTENFRARHADLFRRALSWININDAGKEFAASKLQN